MLSLPISTSGLCLNQTKFEGVLILNKDNYRLSKKNPSEKYVSLETFFNSKFSVLSKYCFLDKNKMFLFTLNSNISFCPFYHFYFFISHSIFFEVKYILPK